MIKRTINLNGVNKMILADPEASLADVIRGQLGLTGITGWLQKWLGFKVDSGRFLHLF